MSLETIRDLSLIHQFLVTDTVLFLNITQTNKMTHNMSKNTIVKRGNDKKANNNPQKTTQKIKNR
jgi:large-conductance mechanosensitive channel